MDIFFYSLWNLDFFRYITPPFCINRDFKLWHTILLDYVSVLYPLCLIALHDFVFHQATRWELQTYSVDMETISSLLGENSKGIWFKKYNSIIDVFSAFFLLSYSKLMFQCSFFLSCIEVVSISNNNIIKYSVRAFHPTVNCGSSRYYQMAVPALLCLCIFNFLPALLLVFYPIKVFWKCLSKCKLDSLSLTAFTEKFYGCYRDGLDGGRDMRSFAGFYFLLRYLPFLYYGLQLHHTFLAFWTYCVFPFLSSAILIALIKPYKTMYMSVLDTLLLAFLAYTCAVLSPESQPSLSFQHMEVHLFIAYCTLLSTFGLILFLNGLIKLYRWLSSVVKAKLQGHRNSSLSEPDDQLEPLLSDRA